jgi:proliferating cell nuclear antigen|tara:strand:+ start:13294 stop:14097 length:804 start_codon:yes stop_codon:yes gene_type:complete
MNSIPEDMSNYKFLFKTVQSSAIRTLIEALKEILTDVNFEISSEGIKVIAMDSSHVSLIYLKLLAENFEKFYCEKPIVCGISILRLFKLLKSMSPNDSLCMFITNMEPNDLQIHIETSEKGLRHKFSLKLMDLYLDKVEIPPAEFSSVLRIPSSDFQKLCRDMNNLGEEIDIKSSGNQLIFSISNDWMDQETVMCENNGGMSYLQNLSPDEVIQGVFSIKKLVLFTKCTSLCQNIEIYLKNDYPIVIKYDIASLGEIKFCLAPKNTD